MLLRDGASARILAVRPFVNPSSSSRQPATSAKTELSLSAGAVSAARFASARSALTSSGCLAGSSSVGRHSSRL